MRQDLRRLSLDNNLIEKLAARDFLGLAKLKYLDISDNPLTDLPPDVFRDIPVWQTLIQLIEIEFIIHCSSVYWCRWTMLQFYGKRISNRQINEQAKGRDKMRKGMGNLSR